MKDPAREWLREAISLVEKALAFGPEELDVVGLSAIDGLGAADALAALREYEGEWAALEG